MKKLNFIVLILLSFSLYAENDPCGGKNMLLNLINRPTFSDSPCTVPPKTLLIESGFQYQKIIGEGTQLNLPELTIRLGLSKNWEFVVDPPNYIHQTVYPFSGSTPVWLGLKHRFFYNKDWIITAGRLVSPPSGNRAFGSPHLEGTVNGIVYHQVTKELAWQIQLGLSEFSDPAIDGGRLYRSFNPNFLLSYTFNEKVNLYLESFAQTKTSATESFGLIQGIGLIYLFNSKTTLDVEFYQRITGKLLGFENFIGGGITRMF
jgi:hypothetical protein